MNAQDNTPQKLTKAEYIARNKKLFYRRGSQQWRIHNVEVAPVSALSVEAAARLAELHTLRCKLVTESLSRFDDPTSALKKFDGLRTAYEAIDASALADSRNTQNEARAWFDTHRFERFADRAGKAHVVADRYADVLEEIDSIRTVDLDVLPRLDQRMLRRLRRDLDDVTAEIVTLNERLVRSYAKNFTRSAGRHDAEDYEGAGMYGLMRAISTFDADAGRFDVWAWKHIQREVLHAFRAAEYVSMNHSDFERRPAVLRAKNSLQAQAEDSTLMPSYEDIADLAGVTVDQVKRVLDAPRVDSLSAKVGDEADTELGDLIESSEASIEASVMTSMMLTAVERHGLSVLDKRELLVLVRRFGLDDEPEQRLASIGTMLGRSREGIRQAESRALAKLRHPVVLRRIMREGRP